MDKRLIKIRKTTTPKKTVELQRFKIFQLKQLLSLCEPHEKPIIRARVQKNQIDLALLLLQKDLERSIDGEFDPAVSRKLDAVQLLLG